ncbi:MAG: WD40 repeat domain-containing protein [bacterium]
MGELEFSPTDPDRLAVIFPTQTKASLVRPSNKQILKEFEVPCCVETMAFSPEGVFLAVSAGYKVKIFNTKSFKLQKLFSTGPMKLKGPEALSYSSGGKYLASGYEDGLIQVFKPRSSQHVMTRSIQNKDGDKRQGTDVVDLQFLPSQNSQKRKLLTLTLGNEVTFWDTRKWQPETTVSLPPDTAPTTYDPNKFISSFSASDLEISPDGNIAIVSNDRDILVISISQRKIIQRIDNAHKFSVTTVSFSPSGKFFVSGGEDSPNKPGQAVIKLWKNPYYEESPGQRKDTGGKIPPGQSGNSKKN